MSSVVAQAFRPASFARRVAPGVFVLIAVLSLGAQSPGSAGVQDPAWSPDGKRLATSYLDRIFISSPAGKNGRALHDGAAAVERDPAWSPDGKSIAFAADGGDGFDIYVAGADGKNVRKVTS